jgi:hypothetical protein
MKGACQKLFTSAKSHPKRCSSSNVWQNKGLLFQARRARFILALTKPVGLRPNQIGAAHGFSVSTSSSLRNRFNATGPEGCSCQFNALASLGRGKLSFDAQERAVALVKTQALALAGIIAKLKEKELVPKSEANGRYALTDTLKRAGMSVQRTRYSLKKQGPLRFVEISQKIQVHLAQEAAGLVRVLFEDESGITQNPSLTQAWAPKGEPHAHEIKTGTRARLNGIGCCDFNLNPASMWFKEGHVGSADFSVWGQAPPKPCFPTGNLRGCTFTFCHRTYLSSTASRCCGARWDGGVRLGYLKSRNYKKF